MPSLRSPSSLSTALTAAALAAGCGGGSPAGPTGPDPSNTHAVQERAALGDTVRLGVGDAVRFDDTDLVVRFDRLIADFRCAADVVCVSAGNAGVSLLVAVGSDGQEHEFWVYGVGRSQTVAGYRVELVDVQPYPRAEQGEPPPTTVDVTVTQEP